MKNVSLHRYKWTKNVSLHRYKWVKNVSLHRYCTSYSLLSTTAGFILTALFIWKYKVRYDIAPTKIPAMANSHHETGALCAKPSKYFMITK